MAARLTVEDRLDVLDLLARYAHAQDEADIEGFLGCFTTDAVLDLPDKQVAGADDLRAFAEYFAAKPGRPGWQHHITNSVIDGEGDSCRVKSFLLWITKDGEGRSVVSGQATYIDDCVKTDGGWRIARHAVLV
jgi:uncharacterized protein (TIGR02246 family)